MAVRQRPVGPSPDQILATLLANQLAASKTNGGVSNSSSGSQKAPPRLGEPGYSEANNEIAKALFSAVASPILSSSGINPILSALGKNAIGMPGTLDSVKTLLAAMGIGSSKTLTRAKAADASRKDSDPDLNGSIGDYQGDGSQAPSVLAGTSMGNLVQSVFGGSSGSGGVSNPFGGSGGGSGGYNNGGGFGGGTNYTGPDTPSESPTVA